jgi:hypothetical protein
VFVFATRKEKACTGLVIVLAQKIFVVFEFGR